MKERVELLEKDSSLAVNYGREQETETKLKGKSQPSCYLHSKSAHRGGGGGAQKSDEGKEGGGKKGGGARTVGPWETHLLGPEDTIMAD